MVLRATPPVWGTALSVETAMKYPVSSQMHTVTVKRPSTFSSELSVGLSRAPCEHPSFFSDFEGAACILFCVLECHHTRCFSLIPSWL